MKRTKANFNDFGEDDASSNRKSKQKKKKKGRKSKNASKEHPLVPIRVTG